MDKKALLAWANERLNFLLLSYQAEKEEQAAIQHQAEEQQPAPSQYTSEWGGVSEQPSDEVSNAAICLSELISVTSVNLISPSAKIKFSIIQLQYQVSYFS